MTQPTIRLTWPSGAEFLEAFQEGEDDGPARFSGSSEALTKVSAGELVSVTLAFLERQNTFHVHAKVLECSDSCAVLEFLPEEKGRQELVHAVASGDSVPYFRRRHERVECELEVKLAGSGGTKKVVALDISEGGVHLRPDSDVEVGEEVELAIAFPKQLRKTKIRGRITAKITEGPQKGVGIEFLFASPQQRERIGAEVTKLREGGG